MRRLRILLLVMVALAMIAGLHPVYAATEEPRQDDPLLGVQANLLGLGVNLVLGGTPKPPGPVPGNGQPLPELAKGLGTPPGTPEPPANLSQVEVTDLRARRPDPAVVSELKGQLRRPEERVQVIVQLRMRWVPEPALPPAARRAQADQIRQLQDAVTRVAPRAQVTRRFATLPSMALVVDTAQLDALARAPQVASIDPVHIGFLEDTASGEATTSTFAQQVGFDGQGWAVAILDTGVERSHEYLGGRVVAEACFAHHVTAQGQSAGDCPNGQTSQTGPGAAAPCGDSDCDHGTHVAGIAAGQDPPGGEAVGNGVAPRASIMAVQVFHVVNADCNGDGTVGVNETCATWDEADVLAGLDWVFQQRMGRSLAAVNMSFGGSLTSTACDDSPLKPAVDQLRSVGIATVKSAGNKARRDAVTYPGCISSIVTVGATTNDDGIYGGSNASAALMDLWAPGAGIRSSVPGGGYDTFWGTSMAAPHVTGAFALARQMRACKVLVTPSNTVDETLAYLIDTGRRVTDNRPAEPMNGLPAGSVAKPRIDVYAATHRLDTVPNSRLSQNRAQSISGLEGSVTGTNACATKDALLVRGAQVEPNHAHNRGGASVWYRWTAPATGTVRFTTMGSSFDTLLAAYELPRWYALVGTPKAQNDDAGGTPQSKIEFHATASTSYLIAVDGYRRSSSPYAASGTVKLNWVQDRPPNDDFATPTEFAVGEITGSTLRSTAEPGEPTPAGSSVWFRWGAPREPGRAILSTNGSGFDTVLDVYRGTSLSNLTLVATDDDSGDGNASIVRFQVDYRYQYFVRLRGYGGQTGSYALRGFWFPSA